MANSFQKVQQEALALIKELEGRIKDLNDEILSANKNLVDSFKVKTDNQVSDRIKQINEEYKKLNKSIREQESAEKQKQSQIDKLWRSREAQIKKEASLQNKKAQDYIKAEKEVENARQKAIKSAQKQRELEQKSRESLNKQRLAAIEYGRAYNVLIREQQRAKKVLQDLAVTQGKNSRETKKAQKEYDKLTAKINKANRATESFAKKGLRGVVGGFRNLLGAFGVVGGVMMFANLVTSTINIIKEFDKLNFTLEKVIRNEGELVRTRQFLNEISIKFGADLLKTSERYIKFYVAAKQAGLETKKVELIFSTFTETSALLGLKTDELTGIFLALEQMLSKGKVTTEELRRQLGERLPGAFDLMAKALNVNTRELDRMLKAGELLSSEALPKLAEEVKNFYQLTGEGVNTLQTASQKLSTSWDLLIESFNKSTGAGDYWQKTLEAMASSIRAFSVDLEGLEAYNRKETFAMEFTFLSDNKTLPLDEALSKLKDVRKEIDDFELNVPLNSKGLNDEEKISLGILKGKADALRSYIKLIRDSAKEEKQTLIETIISYKDKNDIIDTSLDLVKLEKMSIEELSDGYKRLQDIVAERSKNTIGYYKELIQANEEKRKSLKSTNKEDLETAKILTKQNEEYQIQIDLLEAKSKSGKKSTTYLEDTVGWLREQISKNDELIEQSKDRGEISKLQKENKLTQEKIDLLLSIEKITKKINRNTVDDFDNQISRLKEERDAVADNQKEYAYYTRLIDILEKAKERLTGQTKDLAKELKEASKQLSDFFQGFQDDAMSDFGFERLNELFLTFDEDGNSVFDNLLKNAKNAKEEFGVIFNSISEVAQEAFNFMNQNQEAYFEAQLYRLQQQRDIAIQFAGDSATAREEIERQYEEKRREIQQRQAEAEKRNAIINATINTAQAVVSVLAQEPGGLIKKGIAAAIVGAMGAAQIALIAAQPIPEFFRGTMNAPEGWAMVDEKRPEIHTDNKGNIKSFGESKANMRYLDRGDKIYTSRESYFQKELGGILEGNDILPYNQMFDMVTPTINLDSGISKDDFRKEIRSMTSKLMSKETSVVKIDKSGFTSSVIKGSATKHKQNNILTLKGGIV